LKTGRMLNQSIKLELHVSCYQLAKSLGCIVCMVFNFGWPRGVPVLDASRLPALDQRMSG
jgi:hypothetical protein